MTRGSRQSSCECNHGSTGRRTAPS